MWHLSPEELIDLAEGTRSEHSVPHLATCSVCRQQLADLRQALSAVAIDAEAPEPSPLFWDHLSVRVREAVAADPAPRSTWATGWLSWRSAAAMSAVVFFAVALSWRLAPRRVMDLDVPAEVSGGALESQTNASGANEAPFGFVADLAETLDWETAAEAGLTTRLGIVDRAVAELTSDESVELERLLNEALSRPSA